MTKVNLGDKVKDPVTGITGIAVVRHEYLQGCARIGVQGKMKEDGELPNEYSFDEPQLKVVKRAAIVGANTEDNPGGPARSEPTPKSTGSKR